MLAVDLTTAEWRLIRHAVVSMSVYNATDNKLVQALHKKLTKAAESKQICLLINTDKR